MFYRRCFTVSVLHLFLLDRRSGHKLRDMSLERVHRLFDLYDFFVILLFDRVFLLEAFFRLLYLDFDLARPYEHSPNRPLFRSTLLCQVHSSRHDGPQESETSGEGSLGRENRTPRQSLLPLWTHIP